MGLLTKIFGNPEGGASTSGEPSAAEQTSGASASSDDPVISAYPKGDSSTSGIRPVVEGPPQRPRESARANGGPRRPEHPRMYLRPSPATLDPALPGSTRRPQIAVRPNAKETVRQYPPSTRRAPVERSGREASVPRERSSETSTAPRPPGVRPRNALVVSPVSLTPEEVQPGARPKLPTLLGLGAALETPPLPLVAPTGSARGAAGKPGAKNGSSPDLAVEAGPHSRAKDASPETEQSGPPPLPRERAEPAAFEVPGFETSGDHPSGGHSSGGHSSGGHPNGDDSSGDDAGGFDPGSFDSAGFDPGNFDALAAPAEVGAPEDISAPAQLVADFALKLSLGPVSRLWVPEVRGAAEVLLRTAKHRDETALAALSSRLLALLGSEASESEAPFSEGLLDGAQRDQILHEVSRLAGVLPEWPAAAQDLTEEARRRETRVLRELLAAVDGLKRDQRARGEEQLRIEELSSMGAEALAEEFAAPLERASEFVLVLNAYCRERHSRAPDVGNVLGLARALDDLERKCREFDDCDAEQKEAQRMLRLERRRALTAVNLLLAERGEFEWLEQLEPLPIAERAERLKQWLDADSEGTS